MARVDVADPMPARLLAVLVALASLAGCLDSLALRQEAFMTWQQDGLYEELAADGHSQWKAGQRWSDIRRGEAIPFQDASLDAEWGPGTYRLVFATWWRDAPGGEHLQVRSPPDGVAAVFAPSTDARTVLTDWAHNVTAERGEILDAWVEEALREPGFGPLAQPGPPTPADTTSSADGRESGEKAPPVESVTVDAGVAYFAPYPPGMDLLRVLGANPLAQQRFAPSSSVGNPSLIAGPNQDWWLDFEVDGAALEEDSLRRRIQLEADVAGQAAFTLATRDQVSDDEAWRNLVVALEQLGAPAPNRENVVIVHRTAEID